MTTNASITDAERNRLRTIAALGFVLAAVVAVGAFLAFAESAYDSTAFVWMHLLVVVAGGAIAVSTTTLLYGEGARGLGLGGLLGTAFAWLATALGLVWVPIAWEATYFAQTGAEATEDFLAIFSPLGSAYASSFTVALGLAGVGLSIGLYRAGLVHRPVAAVGALLGLFAALANVYGQAMAFTLAELDGVMALVLAAFLVYLLVGGSLYLKRGVADVAHDVESSARA